MKDETKYRIGYAAGRVESIVVSAFVIYGAYSLVKLGYAWVKVGVDTIKERKNINI